jgi:HNH endonuclease
MTTLNIIEELLNIEIGDKVLRNGRIYNEKNRYYWYRNEYYIVNIGDDKWVIMSSNDHTRELLDDYIWRCLKGYAVSEEGKGKARTIVIMHRKLMHMNDNNLIVDHIKRNPCDNRLENLRIVTVQENNRNKPIQKNNTSGIMGVFKRQNRWIARINDNNNNRISKSFTINNNRTDEQCKQLALNQRNIWKEQFNYLGE